MQAEEFIAVDTKRPGGVDLRDDTSVKFKCPVGCVLRRALVSLSLLIHALRDSRSANALHGAHPTKSMVQNIAPMAEHVHDDAAVVLLAVVPGGPLRGLPVALEDPIAKLAPHGKNPAKETTFHQPLQLAHARQKEFVLHDAVLHPRGLSQSR